jgi:hypothetical protein
MRGKMILLVLLLAGVSVSETLAWDVVPDTGKAFIKPNVRLTREEFATAIASNNQSILNVDCMKIVRAANSVLNHNFTNCGALSNHIRQLEVATCPQVETRLARVLMPSGTIDLTGWRRLLRPNERCLFSDNRAEFSLDCGNITPDLYRMGGSAEEEDLPRSVVLRPDTLQVNLQSTSDVNVKVDPVVVYVKEEENDSDFPLWETAAVVLGTAAAIWVVCDVIRDNCFSVRVSSSSKSSLEQSRIGFVFAALKL